MTGLIFTELNEKQTKNIQNFFKKNPKRTDCNIEVEGRKYQIKKETALKSKTIKLMGDL